MLPFQNLFIQGQKYFHSDTDPAAAGAAAGAAAEAAAGAAAGAAAAAASAAASVFTTACAVVASEAAAEAAAATTVTAAAATQCRSAEGWSPVRARYRWARLNGADRGRGQPERRAEGPAPRHAPPQEHQVSDEVHLP